MWLIFHCTLYECDKISSVHPGIVEVRDVYKDPPMIHLAFNMEQNTEGNLAIKQVTC